MANPLLRLSVLSLRQAQHIRLQRQYSPLKSPLRTFQSSCLQRQDDDDRDGILKVPKEFKFDYDALEPEAKADYDSLSPEDKIAFQNDARTTWEHFNSPDVQSELNAHVSQLAYELSQENPRPRPTPERIQPGFFAMGEDDEQGTGEDGDFNGDDISSLAHGELEQHREIREYARIAAWEMPLLSKLAKPFVPPALDEPLRFRYTSYMGENHPASKKIVLEFCTADLPLEPAQRIKFIKLVGVRYNPQKDLVKMSSEMFETQAQNKRYLGDLVDTLIAEARNTTDTFEDVPLDFRHHKFKQKLEFPEAWKRPDKAPKQIADQDNLALP